MSGGCTPQTISKKRLIPKSTPADYGKIVGLDEFGNPTFYSLGAGGGPVSIGDVVGLETALSGIESDYTAAITTAINNLKAGAPVAYDTLLEIANYIASDTSGAAAMTAAINARILISDIVNNLTTNSSTKVLAASQGIQIQNQLSQKQSTNQKNQNNGYAGLDNSGKILLTALPTHEHNSSDIPDPLFSDVGLALDDYNNTKINYGDRLIELETSSATMAYVDSQDLALQGLIENIDASSIAGLYSQSVEFNLTDIYATLGSVATNASELSETTYGDVQGAIDAILSDINSIAASEITQSDSLSTGIPTVQGAIDYILSGQSNLFGLVDGLIEDIGLKADQFDLDSLTSVVGDLQTQLDPLAGLDAKTTPQSDAEQTSLNDYNYQTIVQIDNFDSYTEIPPSLAALTSFGLLKVIPFNTGSTIEQELIAYDNDGAMRAVFRRYYSSTVGWTNWNQLMTGFTYPE